MAYREQPDTSRFSQSQCPDIVKEAREAAATIKSKLVYRDDEELDTGIQKVQPLPYLDEEIEKYHIQIRDSVEGARKVGDDVPGKVLQQVEKAMRLASEGQTSLFKASQLLEFTFDAYQYARLASQDQFDLKRHCLVHFAQFKEAFKKVVELRLTAELAQADSEFEKCQMSIENALVETRGDLQSHETRAGDEDAVVQDEYLQETHEQVKEMVETERNELKQIGEQCEKDVESIDRGLNTLRHHVNQARQQYQSRENQRQHRLEKNRSEQRNLEERLRQLKEEENQLVTDSVNGSESQKEADELLESSQRDILEWKEKIGELKTRTNTSLSVMTCMEECIEQIMVDAKKKKAHWKERLHHLAIECLWMQREALLLKGAVTKLVLEDNQDNVKQCKELVVKFEKDIKDASRRNFRLRVEQLKKDIEEHTNAKRSQEEKIEECQALLREIRSELNSVDQRMASLVPGLKLDTLENRYQQQKQLLEQAFKNDSTDGLAFNFYHSLPQYTITIS